MIKQQIKINLVGVVVKSFMCAHVLVFKLPPREKC